MAGIEVLRTDKSWIKKTPNVCGGDACIRDSRITVWGLVESRRLGLSDEEIMRSVVGVTAADLEAAWTYYEQNREEIETVLREEAEA
jgi:uncharacterized protein (DUF433 family)